MEDVATKETWFIAEIKDGALSAFKTTEEEMTRSLDETLRIRKLCYVNFRKDPTGKLEFQVSKSFVAQEGETNIYLSRKYILTWARLEIDFVKHLDQLWSDIVIPKPGTLQKLKANEIIR